MVSNSLTASESCPNRRPPPDDFYTPFVMTSISHAVWLYYRFSLSLREVEDLLAERGITVSYETIRQWCAKFGLDYAKRNSSFRCMVSF